MLRREPWAGVGHRTFAQSHLRIIRDPTLTKPLHRLGPIALSHGRTFAPRKSDRTLWRLCVSRSHLRTHRTLALSHYPAHTFEQGPGYFLSIAPIAPSHFRTTQIIQPIHASRARGSFRSIAPIAPSHFRTTQTTNPYMRAEPGVLPVDRISHFPVCVNRTLALSHYPIPPSCSDARGWVPYAIALSHFRESAIALGGHGWAHMRSHFRTLRKCDRTLRQCDTGVALANRTFALSQLM